MYREFRNIYIGCIGSEVGRERHGAIPPHLSALGDRSRIGRRRGDLEPRVYHIFH